jgi:Zn-dependent peptidase ImmA (M78 family)
MGTFMHMHDKSQRHVVIGEGGEDKHTLAHELTHVIQQRRGAVAGSDNGAGLSVSDPGDRFEREAEANAKAALRAPIPR